MPDAADIAAFLARYVAECDELGIEPAPVRELAALVELIAQTDGGTDD